jgi:hypothetical protein
VVLAARNTLIDGSGGMLIIKGKSDVLRQISDSDEGQRVIAKAQAIVEDLRSHWYFFGDEEIQRVRRCTRRWGRNSATYRCGRTRRRLVRWGRRIRSVGPVPTRPHAARIRRPLRSFGRRPTDLSPRGT